MFDDPGNAVSHADTIRRYIDSNRAHGKVNAFSYTSLPLDDLDALLAENQRLEQQRDEAFVSVRKREAENQRLRDEMRRVNAMTHAPEYELSDALDEIDRISREALAGDAG